MNNAELDTIVAIATAPGEGGIGIVRISGSRAAEIAAGFFRPRSAKIASVRDIASHHATYGEVFDETGAVIDEALCLPMWAPRSYTVEDVVEIQSHGGIVVVQKILNLALGHGARLAEPGEFTKRAFLNGRLDLSQAQAVMDLIQAKTQASLKVAANNLKGSLANEIKELRHAILAVIAHFEASIDFPEDDIEDMARSEAYHQLLPIKEKLEKMLANFHTGRILREGLLTAIVGKPNVGKSSLLNAILREERAIVTDIPGTTRDSLEEYANLGGIPLRIIDTAGIRSTEDKVERIGVEKSRQYLQQADLILALFDGSRVLDEEDGEVLELLRGRKGIALLTKGDLQQVTSREELEKALAEAEADFSVIEISMLEKRGLEELEKQIAELVYRGEVQQEEAVFINNSRQFDGVEKALAALNQALHTLDLGMAEDFVVIDLRNTWERLGQITGDTVEEDIIDQIFSQFCIGK